MAYRSSAFRELFNSLGYKKVKTYNALLFSKNNYFVDSNKTSATVATNFFFGIPELTAELFTNTQTFFTHIIRFERTSRLRSLIFIEYKDNKFMFESIPTKVYVEHKPSSVFLEK